MPQHLDETYALLRPGFDAMTIDPRVFKAYDVRGLYPQELDEDGAERIGAAFIAVTGAKRVAVGHDTRLSSPSMAAAFAEGALAAGRRRGRARALRHRDALLRRRRRRVRRGRLHHREPQPAPVHGREDGDREGALPLSGDTRHRRGGPHRRRRPAGRGDARGRARARRACSSGSSTRCMGFVDPSAIRGLRVVIDAANGMSGLYLPPVLERLDIDAVPYFLELDGRFPNHEPNPLLPENREFIMGKVRRGEAPTSASPSTATPTAASSSTTPASSWPGDFLTALLATAPAGAHRAGHGRLRPARLAGRAATAITAAGGTPDMYRVGPRLHQAAHARGRRRLRRRGQRPLLLPRLLVRRHRPHPGAAGDGDGRDQPGGRCRS